MNHTRRITLAVTVVYVVVSVCGRLSLENTSTVTRYNVTLAEQASDLYYQSQDASLDAVERLQILSMSLSLMEAAVQTSTVPTAMLDRMVRFDTRRRLRRIRRNITSVSDQIRNSTPPSSVSTTA